MDLKRDWELVKKAASAWVDDYAPSMGAALAYYTVFSIAPLLLIVISIAGLVFGEDAARGAIVQQLQGMMGTDAAKAVEGLLVSVSKPSEGIIGTIVGIAVLIVGATTVFGELQDALDRIWRAPARKTSGIWGLLRARVLSFGMILGVGFLLIASLVVSAGLSALGEWWAPLFGGWEFLLQLVNFAISFGLVTVIFAMIYKIMPRVKIEWHDVWIGAAVTSLLFTVGKFLIGLYVGKSGVASGFGAAGSLVVLLVWVYYSAQIFLMGAEFTWVYAHTFGSLKDQPMPEGAAAVPQANGSVAGAPAAGAKPGGKAPAPAPTPAPAAPGPAAATAGAAAGIAAVAARPQPAFTPPRPIDANAKPKPAAPSWVRPADASLKAQAAAYLQQKPIEGVGLAMASGVVLRIALGLASRMVRRRLPRRMRGA